MLVTLFSHSGGTFWDVGANIGIFGLQVAHQYPDRCVLAFEPSPVILPRLNRNKDLNDLSYLIILPIALSDREEEGVFYLNEVQDNQMMGSLARHSEDARTVRVHTHKGDDLGDHFPELS